MLLFQRTGGTCTGLTEADDQETRITCIASEVPHRARELVAPPADEDVPIHACSVVRLVEGEVTCRVRVGQVDDMQAPGMRRSVRGQGRASSDHHVGIAVHERPVRLGELFEERIGVGVVVTVDEVFHECASV